MATEPLRDRLSALSRAELAGLVLVLVLALGGAGLWYVRSLPKPVQVRADVGPPPVPAPGSPSSSPMLLLVDVAGWVRDPGVYGFAEGARIVDAIEAAGGARPGAALELLNLAAPLVDGTQVLVTKAGAGPPAAPGAAAPGAPAASGSVGGLVNINVASATELEALPGIGEVIAQRIVDHRTANGPFGSVDELMDVSGIGEAILGSIRELVTV